MLVSFDVMSLFTNVPTDLAIQVAKEKLEQDDTLHERTYLNIDNIISLLELRLNATYLQFQQNVYQQIQATSMGSPVLVTVTNLVMEDIEERPLQSFHTPILFRRDMLTILPFFQNCFRNSINIWTVLNHHSSLLVKSKKMANSSSWMFYYQKKMTVVSQHWSNRSQHTLTTIFTSSSHHLKSCIIIILVFSKVHRRSSHIWGPPR